MNATRAISGLGSDRHQLETIGQNEGYAFNDTEEIVGAAIARLLTAQ